MRHSIEHLTRPSRPAASSVHMNEGMLYIPIRSETRLGNQPVHLLPQVGQPRASAALAYERVSELVGSRGEAGRVVEHGEEEGESTGRVVGVGALGVSADHGVVVVGVWGGERVEDEASVAKVAMGRESREGEELGEIEVRASVGGRFEDLCMELHDLRHRGDLHCASVNELLGRRLLMLPLLPSSFSSSRKIRYNIFRQEKHGCLLAQPTEVSLLSWPMAMVG